MGTLMTLMITLAMMITPLAALLVASVPGRCTEPTHPTMFAFRFFISVPLQMRMVIVNEMAHVGANGSPRATRRTTSSHNICGHLPTDGLAAFATRHQAARAPNRKICLNGSGIDESFRTACILLAGLLIAVAQAGGTAPPLSHHLHVPLCPFGASPSSHNPHAFSRYSRIHLPHLWQHGGPPRLRHPLWGL